MQMYAATDLHSQNNYMAIIDEEGRKIFTRKLPNERGAILGALNQHKKFIVGVVVESTFNWYWMADMLMDEEYRVHLANPAAIQKYSGLKNSSDKHDALWLAEMLRLGVLPEGYIYPKEERPIRDLLRRRSYLVKQRTSLILSLKGMISRNYGVSIKSNDIKVIKEDRVSSYFEGDEDSALAGRASKEVIDLMTEKIKEIESRVVEKVKLRDEYRHLLTPLPGLVWVSPTGCGVIASIGQVVAALG
jgi:transposase